jgi:hypothetical protein
MRPFHVAAYLRHIADKIDRSKKPDRVLVAKALKRVISVTQGAGAGDDYTEFLELMFEISGGQGYEPQEFVGKTWNIPVGQHNVTVKCTGGGVDSLELDVSVDGAPVYSGGLDSGPSSHFEPFEAVLKTIDNITPDEFYAKHMTTIKSPAVDLPAKG